MFNSKKTLALCATTIASFSALGTLPQAVLADTSKAGETAVTYEGTAQPAEWGLSVPATVELNKFSEEHNLSYDTAKLAIVGKDGNNSFTDTKDHSFVVNGNMGDATMLRLTNNADNSLTTPLFVNVPNQGIANPDDLGGFTPKIHDAQIAAIQNLEIASKADHSVAPERYIQFGVHKTGGADVQNENGAGLKGTIAWTAAENDA